VGEIPLPKGKGKTMECFLCDKKAEVFLTPYEGFCAEHNQLDERVKENGR
jgi:hypothetical protein